MGVNEKGVAIGNEMVFSKVPNVKTPGLMRMEILRLALERSSSAFQVMQTTPQLLEKYGQSGNCSKEHGLYYHNSFLISDREEAWVLETAGKHWAALKAQDFYTISNVLTITDNWDFCSKELVSFAKEKNGVKGKGILTLQDAILILFSRHLVRQRIGESVLANSLKETKGI